VITALCQHLDSTSTSFAAFLSRSNDDACAVLSAETLETNYVELQQLLMDALASTSCLPANDCCQAS
jgi:hypothetical protein